MPITPEQAGLLRTKITALGRAREARGRGELVEQAVGAATVYRAAIELDLALQQITAGPDDLSPLEQAAIRIEALRARVGNLTARPSVAKDADVWVVYRGNVPGSPVAEEVCAHDEWVDALACANRRASANTCTHG